MMIEHSSVSSEESCSEISCGKGIHNPHPCEFFFLFFHCRYICTTGPDSNIYHKENRRILTFCTSCNMRFICIQCYWQSPKKDPEDFLFWVRKCEFFLRKEHDVWWLLPRGPFAIESLHGTFSAFEIRESERKGKGQQMIEMVEMHASLWFCHSHWGCLVIEPPAVFFLFGATTPLSRKAGTCTEVQPPHCWQNTTARGAPYFMQQKYKDLLKKCVMASQCSQMFTRHFLYL